MIVGSIAYDQDGQRAAVQTLLDLPGFTLGAAVDLFAAAFEEAGWEIRQSAPRSGGLAADNHGAEGTSTYFCFGSDRWAQLVLTDPGSIRNADDTARSLDVRLMIAETTNRPTISVCGDDAALRRISRMTNVFPRLIPPQDAESQPLQFVLTGTTPARSHRVFTTELLPEDLHRHYVEQLTDLGWRRLDAGLSLGTTWSHWQFVDRNDRPWAAVLTVVDRLEYGGNIGPRGFDVVLEALPLGHGVLPTAPELGGSLTR